MIAWNHLPRSSAEDGDKSSPANRWSRLLPFWLTELLILQLPSISSMCDATRMRTGEKKSSKSLWNRKRENIFEKCRHNKKLQTTILQRILPHRRNTERVIVERCRCQRRQVNVTKSASTTVRWKHGKQSRSQRWSSYSCWELIMPTPKNQDRISSTQVTRRGSVYE